MDSQWSLNFSWVSIFYSPSLARQMHAQEVLKIKLEVDTDPPGGFETESRAVLLPMPFAARVDSRLGWQVLEIKIRVPG